MARIRTIKPEFFTSEDIVSLTPLARLFYVSLWCEADREGRLEWKPRTFKLRYFPGDACDIQDLADELVGGGLIELYEVDGIAYAWIPTFTEHQIINNREAASQIPPPVLDPSKGRESGHFHTSPTRGSHVKAEGKGREGKGKEPPPHTPQGGGAFDAFWEAYPRKDAKQMALKRWEQIRPDENTVAAIMASLTVHKSTEQWRRGIIPHAATWLNQRRWMDEVGALGPPLLTADQQVLEGLDQDEIEALRRAKAEADARRNRRLPGDERPVAETG